MAPTENGGQDAQKDLHSRTRRDEKKGKTQKRMESGSSKRSSSAGSEKIERVDGRQEKMEGHCSTSQSLQWAVVPMEEEYIYYIPVHVSSTIMLIFRRPNCISTASGIVTLWVPVQYTGYERTRNLCTEQSPKQSDDTR